MHRLPTRLLMFLGAIYAALTLGAAAAQAEPSQPLRKVPLSALAASPGGTLAAADRPFRWALTANPGVVDGRPDADQILLRGGRRHNCHSLHVEFAAGGQAQSAALLMRRQGRADVAKVTQTDTLGTLDVALRPGRAWQLAGSTPAISIALYANGWVKCRSTKALGNLSRRGR